MIAVKCTYADGTVIKTKTDRTFEEIKEYYEGFTFNIGTVTDNLQKCISVERDES